MDTLDTLVTGGTGTLGRVLVEQLRAAGTPVRVLSRHAGEGRVVGDLATGSGIREAVRGSDVIVHCATGRKDSAAARTLVDAALAEGRPHVVYVSIVGIDRIPLGYYREKLEVERLLTASGLPVTILRATQFHQLVATMLSALGKVPGVLPVPRGIAFQPVAVADVAARLVELACGRARRPGPRPRRARGPRPGRAGPDLAGRHREAAAGQGRPVHR
ncbi:SDR family oxidoreductase, partial [Pseudonocardia pini]|uniref:SDR family oxidoreductase n=1 Tax=Pseudonocardia pini TaxID=2758030 RepID=UPI001FE86959